MNQYRSEWLGWASTRLVAVIILSILLLGGPLLVAPDLYLVFDLPKLVVWQAGIGVVALLCVVSWVFEPERLAYLWQGRNRWVVMLLGGLILIQLLAMWTGVNTHQAWWGNYYRQQGVMLWLTYPVALVIAWDLARERLSRSLLLGGLLGGAMLSGLWALAEYWQIPEYSAWKTQAAYAGRLVSAFGQPNALAGVQAIMIPVWLAILGIGLKLKAESLRWVGLVVVSSVGLVVALLSIAGSGSRGAWVSLGVVGMMGVGMSSLKLKAKSLKLGLLAVVVVFAVIAGLVGISLTKSDWRWRQLVDPADWQNIERVQIWERTIELIAQRPLLGAGKDNLELVFPQVIREEDSHLRQIYVDRAHNGYLERAVETGLLGLLVWLGLVGMILWQRRGILKESWLGRGLIAGIGFYLVRSFFNIDSLWLDVNFWLVLGVLLGMGENAQLKAESLKRKAKNWAGVVLVLALAGVAYWQVELGRSRLLADQAYKLGLRMALVDQAAAFEAYRAAVDHAPQMLIYQFRLADNAWTAYSQQPSPESLERLQQAYTRMEAARAAGEHQADYHQRMALLLRAGKDALVSDWRTRAAYHAGLAVWLNPWKYGE